MQRVTLVAEQADLVTWRNIPVLDPVLRSNGLDHGVTSTLSLQPLLGYGEKMFEVGCPWNVRSRGEQLPMGEGLERHYSSLEEESMIWCASSRCGSAQRVCVVCVSSSCRLGWRQTPKFG